MRKKLDELRVAELADDRLERFLRRDRPPPFQIEDRGGRRAKRPGGLRHRHRALLFAQTALDVHLSKPDGEIEEDLLQPMHQRGARDGHALENIAAHQDDVPAMNIGELLRKLASGRPNIFPQKKHCADVAASVTAMKRLTEIINTI